ncbi:MAG: metal-dependent transcriptional regulator [Calditrichaeota bacterium]|nr:MAG: metal-dependent transcriptional regulator [Calditrichota bacterium]
MISQAIEDYLKIIYKLAASGKKVSTSAIAKKMGVAQASVTGMLKKLADMKLLEYSPYRGVSLTEAGTKIALETIRHHRLLELYLKEAMGYSWDRVHDEAEHLEHHISEEFEEKMDEFLGRPTVDPHGAPIPTKDGKIRSDKFKVLSNVKPGSHAIIRRVSDDDPEKLRYLGELNLYPNTEIEVVRREPFNGPTQIKLGDKLHYLSRELCDAIYVDEINPEEDSPTSARS